MNVSGSSNVAVTRSPGSDRLPARRRHNQDVQLASINHLRVDLLINIFAWLNFDQVLAASQVCSSWRVTALEEPQLWTCLSLREGIPMDMAIELLKRSKEAPVEISLWLFSASVADVLQAHLHRIRSLRIYPSSMFRASVRNLGADPGDIMTLLLYALRNPAPVLECFEISDSHNTSMTYIIPADIFAGFSPALRYVSAYNLQLLSHPYEAFLSVQSMSLSARPRFYDDPDNSLGGDLLARRAELYTNLRHLHLTFKGQPSAAVTHACRNLGSQLDTLRITSVQGGIDLVTSLSADAPWTALYDANPDDMHWVYDGSSPIRSLRVALHSHESVVIRTRSVDGRTREFSAKDSFPADLNQAAFDITTAVPRFVFDSITSLSIHEYIWPAHPRMTIPLLRDCRIFLSGHDTPYHGEGVGIFQLMSYEAAGWDLPNLERITLASLHRTSWRTTRRESLLISAHDILDFLTHHLIRGPTQVALILEFLHLYEPPQSPVGRQLRQAVSSISVKRPTHTLPPLSHATWSDPWLMFSLEWAEVDL